MDGANVSDLIEALLDVDSDADMRALRGLGVSCLTDDKLPPGVTLSPMLLLKVDTVIRIAKEVLSFTGVNTPSILKDLNDAGYYLVCINHKEITLSTHHSCIRFHRKR